MNTIGFSAGEFGDVILNSTLCRTFKELYSDSSLTLAFNKKYYNLLPLFQNHPFIDKFHLWDGYDNWPTEKDLEFLKKENFDIIFNPMPTHKDLYWYRYKHQIDEIHDMHGFEPPKNKQCYLERWFDLLPGHDKTITASVFASGSHPDQLARTFSVEKIIELFESIEELGYEIIRLDTRIDHTCALENKYPASKLSLLEAARLMCSSKLHLTCDTSFSWIADSYSHNTLGWTRLESYVPVNPRGHYFVSDNINDIPLEQIIETIKLKP